MSKTITESEMSFVADNAFHIEESPQYSQLKGAVRSVEFVRAMEDKLIFVEARSSFPKRGEADEKMSDSFQEEVSEICEKFVHSLNLYSSIDMGIAEEGFPVGFNSADKVSLVFVLVINGFEHDWCNPITQALENNLRKSRCIAHIWKPEIFVINDKTAVKRKLIVKE